MLIISLLIGIDQMSKVSHGAKTSHIMIMLHVICRTTDTPEIPETTETHETSETGWWICMGY